MEERKEIKINIIKCSNCGNEVQINDSQSLLKLANIIEDTNKNIKCCNKPDYAPK